MPIRLAAAVLVAAVAALPAAAQTLDRLRESGEIRLGYRQDAAPMSFADADGLPGGYSVMICNAVAQLLKVELGVEALETTFVPVTAEDRFDKVAAGEIDLLCGAATITLERRETVDFSIPTFVDGAAVLLPAGSEANLDALAGKVVGVHAATTTETVLRNSLAAKEINAEIVVLDDHAEGLSRLEAGELDAYFADQSILFALYFSSESQDELVISDNTMTVEKQGLALARGDADFRLAVDRAISALFVDGQMARFFSEALPGATPGPALEALFLLAPELP